MKNYGKMSKYLSRLVAHNHGNALPKFVRDNYSPYILERFEIQTLNHTGAAACEIEALIKIANKDERTVTLRWIYEGEEGKVTMLPKGNGEWKLMSWSVATFLR